MAAIERRRHRRLKLRFPISRLGGLPGLESAETNDLRTYDISTGGMYFRLPAGSEPARGKMVSFQLTVPAGEGHGLKPCTIQGAGRIVRTDPHASHQCGVAVTFTRPVALQLSSA